MESIKFAPWFHLQVDDTVKDNKSKYMIMVAYLQSVVDCGVFEETTVHIIQVGHTDIHCDIDQLLSIIAIYLKVSLVVCQIFVTYANFLYLNKQIPMILLEYVR